jgi:formiminotetrahydrofolate cyclodeaminase
VSTGDDRLDADQALQHLLEEVAHGRRPLASGSAAALTASLAAALVSMVARASRQEWPDAAGAIAQAETLRSQLAPHVRSDAAAYGRAKTLLARSGRDRDHHGAASAPTGAAPPTPNERERELADALRAAALDPLAIAEAAAEVAELAGWVAGAGSADNRADAVNAAILAESAACAAGHLVEINLGIGDGDPVKARAREAAARATAARSAAASGPASAQS